MVNTIKTPTVQELLEAGVHFGHQVRRGNPKMRDYIYGARDGVHIINLEETAKLLKEALEAVYQLGKEGKVLLFVGTKKQAQPLVKQVAQEAGAPYMVARWVGGLLTNFEMMHQNVDKLNGLKEAQLKGELSRYTKKEQLLISRKVIKFEEVFGGVAKLSRLPDAVFITDGVAEKTALLEANRMGLIVIGISDTNADPSAMTYPIPANDDATKALSLLITAVGGAYKDGLKEGGKTLETAPGKAAAKTELVPEVAIPDEEIQAVEVAVEKEILKERDPVRAKEEKA